MRNPRGNPGLLVSTPQDFSGVKVYERTGPVYTVAFKNKEDKLEGPRALLLPLGGLAGAGLIFGAFSLPEQFEQAAFGAGWFILIGTIAWGLWPYSAFWQIEIDFRAGQFRTKRNGRVKFSRPLAPFNLSVEDHPKLEWERAKRGRQGPGPIEKMHALVGWFGAEQSQRVDLLYRSEWPKRYSLQEVAAAVNWSMKRGAEHQGAGEEKKQTGAPRGIRPPLD